MPLQNINRELLPMKIHYFVGVAGAAAILPFLTTVSKQRGYSPIVVGFIFTMIPIPGLLLKPIVGVIIDKYKCHKLLIIVIQTVKSVTVCILMFIPGQTVEKELKDTDVIKSPLFWMFSCCLILYKTASFVRNVVDDTICIGLLGKNKHKYGQQRLWGSIGWGTMSFISGLCVDWYSKGLKHKDYTLGFVFSLVYLLLDIYVISQIKIVQNNNTKIELSSIKKFFLEVKMVTFFIWVIAFGIFNSFVIYFLFLHMEYLSNIYHPEIKSWMKTLQGLSIAIQCAAGEVPFFFLSTFILKRVSHMNVFSLMFFAFSVKFFLYSVIKNPVWILPVEILNGVTFALAYSTMISYAAHLAPDGVEGTLQGITGMAFEGIGLPIGCAVGGYFFGHFGSITTFKLLSGISLMICVIQIIINLLIERCTQNKEVEDNLYSKINIPDDAEEKTTTM